MMVERVTGLVEAHILRQHHRQILVRHRHHAASFAVDHWDRAAPIALPRDAPVAQAEIHLALADWLFFLPLQGGGSGWGSVIRTDPHPARFASRPPPFRG